MNKLKESNALSISKFVLTVGEKKTKTNPLEVSDPTWLAMEGFAALKESFVCLFSSAQELTLHSTRTAVPQPQVSGNLVDRLSTLN